MTAAISKTLSGAKRYRTSILFSINVVLALITIAAITLNLTALQLAIRGEIGSDFSMVGW